ncbi:MAG: response regulator [Anaeromyxobacter sp.]
MTPRSWGWSRTSTRLLAVVLATVGAVLGVATVVEVRQRWLAGERSLEAEGRAAAERLQQAVAYPLWHLDRAGVESVTRTTVIAPDVDAVVVRDETGEVYVGFIEDAGGTPQPIGPRSREVAGLARPAEHIFSAPVSQGTEVIGTVAVYMTDAGLLRERRQVVVGALLKLLVLSVALALVLFLAVQAFIVRPLGRLRSWVESSNEGELGVGAPPASGAEEVGSLAQAFGAMAARVRAHADAVEHQRGHLQAVFDSIRVGLLLVGPDRTVVGVNQAALALSGLTRAEIEGRFAPVLLGCTHPGPAAGVAGCAGCELGQAVEQARERGEAVRGRELRATFPRAGKSSDHWLELGAVPVELEARHALVTIADITDRKRLEQQLLQSQKMETVGQLAGGIAHDFNNILTAILGCAHEIEAEAGLSGNGRECVTELLRAGERAADLTHGLLTFSRKHVLEAAPVDLGAIVSDLQRMIQRLIGETVRVSCRLEEEPLRVLADRLMVEQLLMNLAANARDAMPEGGTLRFETALTHLDQAQASQHHLAGPGAYALLTVSDSGQGMDDDVRQRIFEPFFTTKPVGRGTGLGLAIAYATVQQHGGGIAVHSEVGRGTTFRIWFPLAQGEAAQPAASGAAAAALGGSETVLLVEDEPAVRRVVRRLLASHGYRVLEATDGEQALLVYDEERSRIDLVLSDVIMPRMNGSRLLEELRRRDPQLRILFMSGYSADLVDELRLTAPGIQLLSKPLHPRTVLERIRAMLDAPLVA